MSGVCSALSLHNSPFGGRVRERLADSCVCGGLEVEVLDCCLYLFNCPAQGEQHPVRPTCVCCQCVCRALVSLRLSWGVIDRAVNCP
jgi:hypothetical protein